MSTEKEELNVLIGTRLREEREKTGLSQDAISSVFGVSTKTWGKYERGVTTPDAVILTLLGAQYGLDIFYVLFGSRSRALPDISDDEIELIKIYRSAPLAVKAAALAALTAGSGAASGQSISVQGNSQRIAGRDFHENKE